MVRNIIGEYFFFSYGFASSGKAKRSMYPHWLSLQGGFVCVCVLFCFPGWPTEYVVFRVSYFYFRGCLHLYPFAHSPGIGLLSLEFRQSFQSRAYTPKDLHGLSGQAQTPVLTDPVDLLFLAVTVFLYPVISLTFQQVSHDFYKIFSVFC